MGAGKTGASSVLTVVTGPGGRGSGGVSEGGGTAAAGLGGAAAGAAGVAGVGDVFPSPGAAALGASTLGARIDFFGSAGGRLLDSTAPAGGPPARGMAALACSHVAAVPAAGAPTASLGGDAGACTGAGAPG